MKAARIMQWNEPLVVEDTPEPAPGADQVLVRVRAATVNPIDRMIASGTMASMYSLPLTPGTDFSGEVVEMGANVRHVRPGDAVYGMSLTRGTFAELAVVSAEGVAPKPRSVDDAHAATAPLSGLTAWQTLFNLGKLSSGQRILIHGAGGGVGSLAIQMAKNAGAYVIATERPDKREFVRQIGADEVLDTEQQRIEDAGQVDVVLDLVGGDLVNRLLNVVKSGGHFVSTIAELDPDAGKEQGIHATTTFTQPTVDELTRLAQEIDAGRLKLFANHTFPLAEAQTALHYRAQGDAPGNIVITIP